MVKRKSAKEQARKAALRQASLYSSDSLELIEISNRTATSIKFDKITKKRKKSSDSIIKSQLPSSPKKKSPPKSSPSCRCFDNVVVENNDGLDPQEHTVYTESTANITEQSVSSPSPQPPKSILKKNTRYPKMASFSKKKDEDDITTIISKTRSLTKDAWMCSYCSAIFSSYSAAEMHEQSCIENQCNHLHLQQQPIPTNDDTSTKRPNTTSPALQEQKGKNNDKEQLLLNEKMRQYVVITDDAIRNNIQSATSKFLSFDETDAENELWFMKRDRDYYESAYYDDANGKSSQNQEEDDNKKSLAKKIKTKLSEAYDLIKEGGDSDIVTKDHYANMDAQKTTDIHHDYNTMYVNVVVKNSVQVVNHELRQFARIKWEEYDKSTFRQENEFTRFRANVQLQMLKLASIALAQDFTPRRIAVQLSNDLYRLLKPQLKLRGVAIETNIEYRLGAFFVLGVNIKSIDWLLLMKYTYIQVTNQKTLERALKVDQQQEEEQEGFWRRLRKKKLFPTKFEAISHMLYLLYFLHWIVSVPFCMFWYYLGFQSLMRMYILTSVTDDIFRYVEEKGMEMSIMVSSGKNQTPFMLDVLREQRAEEYKLKKKRRQDKAGEGEDDSEAVIILGPLLGKAVKQDKGEATMKVELQDNLEFEGVDVILPVGFRRLRWAMLSTQSTFIRDAVFEQGAKFENIVVSTWSHHNDDIGKVELSDDIDPKEFIGAEVERSYLMPKSAFVKANTAYETVMLTEYNDSCFSIKICTRTPEVPFGNTFLSWTQYVVVNLGKDSCRLICSIEAEFPDGKPMVARQITSGLRTGATEFLTLFAETVIRYSNVYP